jgi:16S rRNA (adenine1518-N6/adenine1519-N6)-dimethyltransferase
MNLQPRKRFAQHWLRSEKALDRIVQAADISQSDRLLEIGPGTGNLTHRLLPLAQSVAAVEIDRDLCQKLAKKFGATENFLLLQGDILTLNLDELLTDFPAFQNPKKVVANIPYNITGMILQKLLGTIAEPTPENYDLIVLLVQKEVAQRLYANPGSKAYGALSVKIQYLAKCEFICDVPASAFYPRPKVDSVVVRLRPQLTETLAQNAQHLEKLVKLGFANKRKMLKNNLKGILESDGLRELLERFEINPQCRAEDLSVAQWVALSNALQLTINN